MAKVLRKPAVQERTGLSPMQLYRLEKAGDFPLRIQLGPNSVGWLEEEVDNWIKARAAKRTPFASPDQPQAEAA